MLHDGRTCVNACGPSTHYANARRNRGRFTSTRAEACDVIRYRTLVTETDGSGGDSAPGDLERHDRQGGPDFGRLELVPCGSRRERRYPDRDGRNTHA